MAIQKLMFFVVAFLLLITLSSAALSLSFVPPNSTNTHHEVAVSSVMFLFAPFFLGNLALSRHVSKKLASEQEKL